MCVELQFLEEHQQRVDVHRHQIGDRAVAHAHVERFLAQAAAAAFGAARLARVARLHHAELNLAPFAVDVFEEAVQTVEVFVARPQQALLFGRQFVVGRVDREVELAGVFHQLLFPQAHGLAAPAGDGAFVDRLALVGDDQILVDADDFAVALAAGTGTQRVVEAEQVFGGLFEGDSVGLEARRKLLGSLVGQDAAHAVAVGERAGHGVAQARGELLVGGDAQAVDDHRQLVGPDGGIEFRQQLLDETCAAVVLHALDAVAHEQRQLLDDALPLGGDQRRCDERFRSLAEREDVLGHVVDVVALHLAARYGREGAADAGEEQFEVVVDLGGGADRRTRVARVDLLLDGDGRRDPRDEVDVGLVDLAQKLPGVGRQALHVAALPLGEDRVEGQGRFARAGEARDDGERVVRDFHLDVSEVVYPRSLDMDAFRFVHVSMVAPSTLRSRSVNRSARLARIRSTIDERLSNRCDSTAGCSSLTMRMMSFIAA